ncbi:MAG: sensor histidine kinase, partial [Desulfatiglandales bacterium]
IAHEINNPLAIMGQELEWIQYLISSEENLSNEKILEIKDSIEELNKQIRRCSDVTHRLLSLARKTDLVFQETNVNDIVEDVISLVEKEAKLKGISVVRVLDSCIPGIMTDPPLLKQVLLNLCNNALYAVGENGRVVVRTGIQNKEVIIEVEDKGPGIPKELLGKVFDPFFTTKEPGKGTGLGLSISQNIVHKLGGTISVESKPSKGTIFQVRIPMEVSHGSK